MVSTPSCPLPGPRKLGLTWMQGLLSGGACAPWPICRILDPQLTSSVLIVMKTHCMFSELGSIFIVTSVSDLKCTLDKEFPNGPWWSDLH